MRHKRSSEHVPEFLTLAEYREQQNFLQECTLQKRKRIQETESRSKYNSASPKVFEEAKAEARERMRSGDWTDTHALVFLALYCIWHEKQYAMATPEFDATRQRKHFILVASSLIKTQFNGNSNDYAEFMRWMIEQHTNKNKWKASKSIEQTRLNAYAFVRMSHVADFKFAYSAKVDG